MWMPMKNRAAFAFVLLLGACAQESPLATAYKEIAANDPQEIARLVCQKSPVERVDLYLYGVEKRRPSNYALMPNDCIDAETVDTAVNLIRRSTDDNRTFALAALLHEAPESILRGRMDAFDAGMECSKFFSRKSPCHDLAGDIDAVYGRKVSVH